MPHDPKCHELAAFFLEDDLPHAPENLVNALAEEIQDTIEDFLQGEVWTQYKKWRKG